jgi:hypothetical protein
MTTKSVRNVKLVIGKDGKTRLAKVRTYMAGNREKKAAREAAAWQKKTPPKRG